MEEYEIQYYERDNGTSPFVEWEDCLTRQERAIVTTRLARVRKGNFGDKDFIEGSKCIYELIVDFGPGYRIYYAIVGKKVVLLLCGGKKKSQSRDIEKAKEYYKDYLVSQ
jgi:putative addiction module killer protein